MNVQGCLCTVQCATDLEHLYRIYSIPKNKSCVDVQGCLCTVQCATDLEYLYRIFFIPTHDKHQWLLLQFIVLLMMDAKGV